MADRPTPEQIAENWATDIYTGEESIDPYELMDSLSRHGYVIVHPDDIPVVKRGEEWGYIIDWLDGWNDCRKAVVGDD